MKISRDLFIKGFFIGLGATILMDATLYILHVVLDTKLKNYAAVGKWVLNLLKGEFFHDNLRYEPTTMIELVWGWFFHFIVGIFFALGFLLLSPIDWLKRPTLLPPLIFGVFTVIFPFFILQPALGVGFAASNASDPNAARLDTFLTHTLFGIGLYFRFGLFKNPNEVIHMVDLTLKYIFSSLAVFITFAAFIPYIIQIRTDKIKPHVFSWIIWGTTTVIIFLAQFVEKSGAGAWPIGVSGMISLYIAALAYWVSRDISATREDWVFLFAAILSIFIWFITTDTLLTIVIITVADLLGFGPTIRKVYLDPFQESLTFFALLAIRNLLVLLALERYVINTVLFPGVIGAACLALSIMIITLRIKRSKRLQQ